LIEHFDEGSPIQPPPKSGKLTNQQILLGPKLDPLDVIKIYSPNEWEHFIREWLEGVRGRYREIRRAAGAGDKGRDVIAYVGEVNANGPWDNFQCKHYDHGLYPSDMWKELAKLCYYTFVGEYSVPRAYYFVAPRGVGPEGLQLLESPEKLKTELTAQWAKGGLLSVAKKDIALAGALEKYVESFNFAIVKDMPPSKIIEEHRETRFYAARFGGGLVRLPPDKVDVPEDVLEQESRYVEQLLQAYASHASQELKTKSDLEAFPLLKKHFDRQRNYFFLAEELRNFTRDNIRRWLFRAASRRNSRWRY
jgi:hypothetical protein